MKLPDYIYLVTVEGEWPVTAIAADHPGAADQVAAAVKRRSQNAHGFSANVQVWRVPVPGAVEMKVTPSSVLPAAIEVVSDGALDRDDH